MASSPDRRHTPAVPLDEIDKRIIDELQHDGRIAYADLAPKLGLSPAATRQRVQRLLDSGVVDVVGVTVLSAGSFDLLVEVIAEDTGALLGTINDRMKTITGVRRVESFLYFGIHTHRFGWSVR